ncbi:MAG: DedA family protein [Gemmatimonadota bacterium]|jgi:membrane-associated protein|nr:DedA family protein [Gemmatimonadota bacterium]
MELLQTFVEYFLHIDTHLVELTRNYGVWVYAILFLIIFCETGLVVTPFLPGDSILFAAGTIAAAGGKIHPAVLILLLSMAAILGDSLNYSIGSFLGTRVFREGNRILKPEYLDRTSRFYGKHGGKTIILARFIPIVRTYAPFVAGAGKMAYSTFAYYNVAGGIIWITLFVLGGYLFGTIPIVQENFGLVVIAVILLSIVPVIVEGFRAWRGRAKG